MTHNNQKQRTPREQREDQQEPGPLTPPKPKSNPTPDRNGPSVPSNMVPLPEAPKTTSPVPWLTSIHATPGRGNYGDAAYRGNCSGLLIKDLLRFYQPAPGARPDDWRRDLSRRLPGAGN